MSTRFMWTRFGGAGVVILCALLGGCDSRSSGAKPAPKPASDPLAGMTLHSYTVRGEVVSLPSDTSDLQVRHEAIPEFKNPDGTLGMDTMTMPFWPPQGVSKTDPRIAERIAKFSLDGIDVGEAVDLTFEVLWDAEGKIVGFYAVSIAPLPAGTALDFSPLKEGPTITE